MGRTARERTAPQRSAARRERLYPRLRHYEQPPAPPAAAPSADDTLQQLKELGELKSCGVLTESEFQA